MKRRRKVRPGAFFFSGVLVEVAEGAPVVVTWDIVGSPLI